MRVNNLCIGIIGYGGMAAYHVSELTNHTAIHFKGVYDVSPERMAAAKSHGLIPYASLEDLLGDADINLVLIATTNDVHKELSMAALRANKHVLCEKPVTLTASDLKAIMAVAKEMDLVFTINQNRRTNKDFILMKNAVDQGLLGSVYWIESRVEGSRGMPRGWRTMKELGGGMLYDWGVHLIDQLLWMLDERVTKVYCQLLSVEYPEVDDNFRLLLTFESGTVAQIEVATNNYITHPRWYVLGKQGTLQIDSWDCEGKIVRCIHPDAVWEDEIVYTKAGPTKTMAPRRLESTETIALSEPLDALDHLSVIYDNILGVLQGNEALNVTPEQALRVLQVIEAAFKSHDLEQVVSTDI